MLVEFSEKEQEIIKEISKDASNQAAEALSKMVNKNVKVDFPSLTLQPKEELEKMDGHMIVSITEVIGDVTGNMLIVYPKECGLSLVELMMMQPSGTLKELNSDAESAFKEFVNIIAGAYLSNLANHLNFKIFPSPPLFLAGEFKNIRDNIIEQLNSADTVLMVNNNLHIEGENVDGTFFILLDNQSLKKVIDLISQGKAK